MYIPGINYYVPKSKPIDQNVVLGDYLVKLEAGIELGLSQDDIKRNMEFYNNRILEILEENIVLPHSISKHFKLIPQKVILNLKEVEWNLDCGWKLELLGEFVRQVDVAKMKLWHIRSKESVEEILGLKKVNCGGWNSRIISHESFLKQFTKADDFLYRNGVLCDQKGRDGFI